MKKKLFKNWVVKVLGYVLGGYVFFLLTTIDNLGNDTYNKILLGYTILAGISYYLLVKHSNIFDI